MYFVKCRICAVEEVVRYWLTFEGNTETSPLFVSQLVGRAGSTSRGIAFTASYGSRVESLIGPDTMAPSGQTSMLIPSTPDFRFPRGRGNLFTFFRRLVEIRYEIGQPSKDLSLSIQLRLFIHGR